MTAHRDGGRRGLFLWIEAVRKHGPPDSQQRHLLRVFADYMNSETPTCNPSQATIAREMCIGERHVRRLIAAVVKAGWIKVSKHVVPGVKFPCCSYHAVYPPAVKAVILQQRTTDKDGSL